MKFCPNYKNKEVFDGFNEMVESFGGAPLSEEEFRSSELRNQRTGRDFSAMEATYMIYDKNNGNLIDRAPNGEPSILFQKYLEKHNGNRTAAIVEKSEIYSEDFVKKYGDWQNIPAYERVEDIPNLKKLDSANFIRHAKAVLRYEYYIDRGYLETEAVKVIELLFDLSSVDFYQGDINGAQGLSFYDGAVVIKSGMNLEDAVETFVHEVIHNFTTYAYDTDEEFRKEMDSYHKLALLHEKNFSEDVYEFMADTLEPDHASVLMEIPSPNQGKSNLLKDIINTFVKYIRAWFKNNENRGLRTLFHDIVESIYLHQRNNRESRLEEEAQTIKEKALDDDTFMKAPNGKPTNLTEQLWLQVRTKNFINWFGDWINDPTNASKVVDENGEPRVVYHNSKENKIDIYDLSRPRNGGYLYGKGIYSSSDKEYTSTFGKIENALFVNIKNPFYIELRDVKNASSKNKMSVPDYAHISRSIINNSNLNEIRDVLRNGGYDGIIGKFKSDHVVEYVVHNPNQIKSATDNIGTFSTENDDIRYRTKLDINGEPDLDVTPAKQKPSNNKSFEILQEVDAENLVEKADVNSFFGSLYDVLLSGNAVSSQSLVQLMLSNKTISAFNKPLINSLLLHDIPVIFKSLNTGEVAAIYIDKSGQTVIAIDPIMANKVSNLFLSEQIIHEIVHGVTLREWDNPQTKEGKVLKKNTLDLFNLLTKIYPEYNYSRLNVNNVSYALSDPREFVAVYMSDDAVRNTFMAKAKELDRQKNSKLMLALKKFINSVTSFLVNKNVFNLTLDKLNLYQNQVILYIFAMPQIRKGNITDKQLEDAIYNRTSETVRNAEQLALSAKTILFYFDNADRFNSLTTIIRSAWDNFRGVLDIENKYLSEFRAYASSALARRALGAKSSKMAPDVKLRAQRVAEAQSKMFAADETQISSFDAIAQFLDQLTPQLLEDLKYIKTYRTETGTWKPMDESEYGYYVHNTFYAYDAILQQLSSALNNIREEDLGRNTTDPNSIIKSYKDIKKACEICRSLVSESIDYLTNIMRVSGRDILELIGKETNSLDMMAYLEDYGTLDTIDYDTNKFILWVGSIDGAKDEILRALSTIVTNANHSADRQAYSKVSELLKLIGELKMTESIKSLYELDEDGNTTQYMVRELNFGKFWNRYNDFLKNLNKKYGLGEENRRSPDDEEIREKWNKERNDWLSKNCHRKYVPEYYAAYNKISYLTEQTRNRINSEINAIKAKYTLPNGELDKFPDFTDEDFTRLLSLYSERERCKSLYTEQNTLKVEGTPEYQIAVEWRQLDEDLKALREKYGSHEDLLAARNVELWRQRRNAIIEECGGKAEMDKGIEGNFDFNKLRDWDIKHSRLQWKRDSDGNVKLFAEIERGMRGNTPLYEVNGDGGALYNKLKERKLDLLRPARYKSNGEVDPNLLSISTRIEIKKIDNEIKRVLNIAKQQNPALAAISKVYGEQIQKRVLFIGSRLWEKARQLAALAGEDVYELFETTTGFYIDEDDIEYRINSWFLRPVERPEYYGKYIELIPGDFYIDYEQDNVLKDKEYQKYEDYDVSMIPKKVSDDGYSYDNSAAYKKIQNSKTLKAVYEAALEVNRLISENYETKFDMWLLPSITGTLNKKMKKKSGKGSGIGLQVKTSAGVLAEHVGNKFGIAYELGMMEDVDFGQTLEQLVSQFDESGFLQEAVFGSSMYGAKADGSDLGVIPKYYLGKLKDPTQVSWDLADMLYQSVRQSYRYKERSLVKDKCDLLLDVLSKRKYQNPTKKLNLTTGKLQYTNADVSGEKTGTYNAAKKFLDRNMYNRRALRGRQEFNIFNHNIVVNWGKLGSLFRNIAVLVNLGFKPTIAMAGLLTAAHVHLMNAITGSITGGARYSGADFGAAFALTTWEAVKSLSEGSFVANNRSGNKLLVLMEHFNVSDQAGKKFKKSNWNRAQRVAKSVTSGFSFLSACDFIIKSNVMTAVLLSYRYYEGEFQTEEDVRFANRNKSKEELRNIIKDFKHSKSLYTLLKVKEFTNEDGQKVFDVVVDDEYKKAYDSVENVVHSRILKYAENADGIPTEEQKSQISTNFLGACVIMHRQYLPLILQERYGPTVWDNDTRQYNQGQFRSVGTALVNCLKYSIVKPGEEMNQEGGRLESAVMNGLLLGMLGTFFAPIFGPFACLITGAIGTVGGALSYKAYNKVFKNNQNDREYLLSRTRRQHLVKTIAEISYYRMYAWLVQYIISPWVEDEKDWYLLQMLMFSLHKYQWEQFNAYRFDDVLLNFKSASAATNLMDRVKEGLQATPAIIYNSITQRANLGDKYVDFSDNSELDEYSKTYRKNSAYGRDIPFTNTRWTKGTKALFEMVPASNLYKDYYGARQKDNYFKHQIMHQK